MAYATTLHNELSDDELKDLWEKNPVADLTVLNNGPLFDKPSLVTYCGPIRETLSAYASACGSTPFDKNSGFDEVFTAIMQWGRSRCETIYFFKA